MPKTKKLLFLIVSIGTYLISLSQESFCMSGSCDKGFWKLILGWLGFLVLEPSFVIWFANPMIFMAWGLYWSKPKTSLIFALLGLILALCFFAIKDIISDEAGNRMPITGYRSGYWLWLASHALVTMGCILNLLTKPAEMTKNENISV